MFAQLQGSQPVGQSPTARATRLLVVPFSLITVNIFVLGALVESNVDYSRSRCWQLESITHNKVRKRERERKRARKRNILCTLASHSVNSIFQIVGRPEWHPLSLSLLLSLLLLLFCISRSVAKQALALPFSLALSLFFSLFAHRNWLISIQTGRSVGRLCPQLFTSLLNIGQVKKPAIFA